MREVIHHTSAEQRLMGTGWPYNHQMATTPKSAPNRPRLTIGAPVHYVAFNLAPGPEYVCVPSVVRELGLEKTVRGLASPAVQPKFEFRTVRGGANEPGTWHYPDECDMTVLDAIIS
jgi:hypothetical protein